MKLTWTLDISDFVIHYIDYICVFMYLLYVCMWVCISAYNSILMDICTHTYP